MHICLIKSIFIGSDNNWRQAIIWTNAGVLLIGTNFSEILIKIQTFSFRKRHMKMSSAKWLQFLSWPHCVKSKACPYSPIKTINPEPQSNLWSMFYTCRGLVDTILCHIDPCHIKFGVMYCDPFDYKTHVKNHSYFFFALCCVLSCSGVGLF